METCVRGFSYMPQQKLEATDLQPSLQYIESGELERTWRTNRRQRLKEQEQKIWEEFVKEKDIVKNAFTEDPYQFLHELPQGCLKELMDTELQKMMKETEQEPVVEQPNQGEGDQSSENQAVHTVIFAAEGDKPPDLDMYQIFDEEVNFSGADDDAVESPSTVRERNAEDASSQKDSVSPRKSSENVSSLIESSIYCAKVKELRMKLIEELVAVISSLGVLDASAMESEEVARRARRSSEFCARFSRVYMYPIKRQANEIKRHETASLPLARRTQYQAQLARAAALHHDLLQALQVFHKSFSQTLCLRESCDVLRALAGAARDTSALGSAVPPPDLAAAAADLYDDELCAMCDRLEEALSEHKLRAARFLSADDVAADLTTSSSPTLTSKTRGKQRKESHTQSNAKSGASSSSTKNTDGRLSMYSLDTLRINLRAGSRGARAGAAAKSKKREKSPEKSPKNHKASKCRRPLMRAPRSDGARSRLPHDTDVPTLVEAVDAVSNCPSSHASALSRPTSPPPARPPRPPRFSDIRRPPPRSKVNYPSPKAKTRRPSPKPIVVKKNLSAIKNDTMSICTDTKSMYIVPVSRIQCIRKEKKIERKSPSASLQGGENSRRSDDKFLDLDTFRRDHDLNDSYRNHNLDSSRKHVDTPRRSKQNSPRNTFEKDSSRDKQQSRGGSPGKDSSNGKESKDSGSGKVLTDTDLSGSKSPCKERDVGEREKDQVDMARLLRQLCSGDPSGSRNVKITGAKNAQLLCIRSGSPPRQPSTPQLLRILEETIQKQAPKPMFIKPRNPDRYRLTFNIPEQTSERMFQYRTKFVQHMLTSAMYANSAVGKPWEMIGSVSEQILNELLSGIAREMEIKDVIQELYKSETK